MKEEPRQGHPLAHHDKVRLSRGQQFPSVLIAQQHARPKQRTFKELAVVKYDERHEEYVMQGNPVGSLVECYVYVPASHPALKKS